MDNDIPLPHELEWLEATSRFHEDYLNPSSPDPYPYPSEDERSPSPDPQINGPKRPRPSDGQNSPDHEHTITLDHPKRSKVDEDWLRYSPPRQAEEEEEEEEEKEEEEETTEVVVEEKEEEEEEEEERIISRYASEIDGEFFPVTAPSGGDRVYAKVSRVWKEGERCRNLDLKSQLHGLTSEPIDILLQRVEQEAFTKALHASSEIQSDAVHSETHVAHDRLWVDKYAPNSFTELLSDEQTNREVLLWLKQWDETVFGSEIRSTSDEVLSALRRHSSAAQHKKPSDSSFVRNRGDKWNNGSVKSSNVADHTNGHFKGIQALQKSKLTGPPEQKILLLCGPPGLGKTTLAHVAAKHCGYRVVEVNASDDRSTSAIEAKILDVVQMNSVIAVSRPKCLVIDEIDGALADGKGAVEVILKMVSGERKSNNGKGNIPVGEQAGRISSKKGHKTASLLRPVICICNDLYTPALRPLRQVAKVHIFVQPTVSRVVSRLKYICNNEGMTANSISLAALAEYTECDIRSCLNTLQFLNKKKETLNMLEIGTQVVGRKDMSRSAFDIWKEIFQKRKVKRDRHSSEGMANDFNYLLSLVSNRGDYDLILDGIHENILQIKYHDPVMQKTVKCFNGLGISDLMHQTTMRTQQMSLLAYQPSIAIIIHHLVAQIQKQTIEWPKSCQRYRTTLMEKMDTLRSWQNQMPSCISRHLSTKSFVEDSISPLLHILSPSTLRPVAQHLLSAKEKADLAQLIGIMVSYSVTYKNIKSNPVSHNAELEALLDASALSFDPPFYDFINFQGYCSNHFVLPTAMKQVLVHEVEKEKILLVSKSMHSTDGFKKHNAILVERENDGSESTKVHNAVAFASDTENQKGVLILQPCNPCNSVALSNLDSCRSATSSVKPTTNSKKHSGVPTSFFDRFRKASVKVSQTTNNAAQKETSLKKDSHPVLFKFNEGFTNAIKRPVRMREFLI